MENSSIQENSIKKEENRDADVTVEDRKKQTTSSLSKSLLPFKIKQCFISPKFESEPNFKKQKLIEESKIEKNENKKDKETILNPVSVFNESSSNNSASASSSKSKVSGSIFT